MIVFFAFAVAVLWVALASYAFATNRVGAFKGDPKTVLFGVIGISMGIVGTVSTWTSLVILIAALIAYLVRRPRLGFRGHLWAFSMTMLLPGVASLAYVGWRNLAAATQALNLIHLGLIVLLIDCYSAYLERKCARHE